MLVFLLFLIQPVGGARAEPLPSPSPMTVAAEAVAPEKLSPFQYPQNPGRPRNYVLPPLACLFLPGFDQWIEGQFRPAVAYSGVGLGGLLLMSRFGQMGETSLLSKNNRERFALLGGLLYQGAGGMSAYHSFRSSVLTRKPLGEFGFLKEEETSAEILLAPADLSYAIRPTTFVPLGVGLALNILAVKLSSDIELGGYTLWDTFFTGAYSWNAGTHEEAVFRGTVMPMTMQWMGSELLSNTTTALLFAAAHLPSNPRPWPQFLLGWYLGWLTQKNRWTISESVFLHVWWDVMAFTTIYLFRDRSNAAIWVPVVEARF